MSTVIVNGNGHNGHNKISYFPHKKFIDPLQPHSIEAEQGFLGSLLIDPDAIVKVSSFIQAGHFFTVRHGWIYQAILDLNLQNKPADFILVCDELENRGQLGEIGGGAYLTELIGITPTPIHVEHYARLIFKKSMLRGLIEAAGAIARLGYDQGADIRETMDKAESFILKATSFQEEGFGPATIQAGLDRYYAQVEYLAENQNKLVGLPTGLLDLDKITGGLQRSDMIVLAGRPGMGKTSLALDIARKAARRWGKRVAIFSLEMSEEQLIQRLIAAESGIDSQRLRMANIKEDEWPVFYEAIKALNQTKIVIDDTPALSVLELRSRARRLAAEDGLDLLIIDYLQLMNAGQGVRIENRQQEVSAISRGIKALARELDIPILALSQLSRACEGRQDKHPILSDLRDSGGIEQDSDVVIFVYRDEIYHPDTQFPNIADITVAKQRSGPTGSFSVYFKKHLAQFVDLEVRLMRDREPMDNGGPRQVRDSLTEWLNRD